ncbi:Subtilisin-like serine protease [uncultured archaeon]|nr:Subtilisin-like serine protease [uncultured archaeon]
MIQQEQNSVEGLLSKGSHVERRLKYLNVLSGEFIASDLRLALKSPYVESAYFDRNVSLINSVGDYETQDWRIPSTGASAAWGNLSVTGKNVTVAIIDTGIDYLHPDLGGCLGTTCKVVDGVNLVSYANPDPMDDNGHGTHCAGIVAAKGTLLGVAPDARLLAVKVFDSSGTGSVSNIIAGIDWAVGAGADVLSMSVGGLPPNITNDGADDPMAQAAGEAVEYGVVPVVAAANAGPGTGTVASPGDNPDVITVGASDDRGTIEQEDDTITAFSSRGPSAFGRLDPDVSAPGFRITSTYVHSVFPYLTFDGTSMATPHVSGVAALLKEGMPNLSARDFKSRLMHTASKIDAKTFEAGAGEVNIYNALTETVDVSINGTDRLETELIPGTPLTVNVSLINHGNDSTYVWFEAENLSNIENDVVMSSSYFTLPGNVSLPAGGDVSAPFTLIAPLGQAPFVYGGILVVHHSNRTLRVPIVATVPLIGAGLINGTVNDAYVNERTIGDYVYYLLYNPNATSLSLALTWGGVNDIELYLASPGGGILKTGNTTSLTQKTLVLQNLTEARYWAIVHLNSGLLLPNPYTLNVSYVGV